MPDDEDLYAAIQNRIREITEQTFFDGGGVVYDASQGIHIDMVRYAPTLEFGVLKIIDRDGNVEFKSYPHPVRGA